MSQENLKEELSLLLKGKVLIVGIGNTLRSDDGFGPTLVNQLKSRINAACLDVGPSPENFIGKIVRLNPDVILFIDAVSMDSPPATVRLISEDQVPVYGFSTHNMSPKLMIDNIKSQINTKVALLGIEPSNLEFGEQLSEEINNKVDYLKNIFLELLKKEE